MKNDSEQAYLDAWLIGTKETKSQELLGAAAMKFGLSLGSLPVSAEAQKALDGLYGRTQARLKEMGIETIKLYRGLEEAGSMRSGAWEEGPLSSWTPIKEMAGAHAQGAGGRVIATTVTREKVVGFYGTKMGSSYTQEYVISGGKMEIEVEKVGAIRAPYAGDQPGTMAVPAGKVRLYHYTSADLLNSIWKQGLLKSAARGASYDEPAVVWGSTKMPNPNSLNFVEFMVAPEKIDVGHPHFSGQKLSQEEIDEFQQGDHDVTLFGSVPPEDILDVHLPWHEALRYLENDAEYYQQDMAENPGLYEPQGDKRLDPAVIAFKAKYGIGSEEIKEASVGLA